MKPTNKNKPLASSSVYHTLRLSELVSQTHRPLKLPKTSVHQSLHGKIKQEKLKLNLKKI